MHVLLDENLPHAFGHLLTGHAVSTVTQRGWKGVKNGKLLAIAAANGLEALLTLDSGIAHEHHLPTLPIAIVIIKAMSNDIEDLQPLAPAVLAALDQLEPRTLVRVG